MGDLTNKNQSLNKRIKPAEFDNSSKVNFPLFIEEQKIKKNKKKPQLE